MKTIELHFDTSSTCADRPAVFDGEEVLERAMELQFRWIRINWADIAQVTLPVEDDAMFLAMTYAVLDDFFQTGHRHHLFLGDGLLDVTAELEGETVTMTVRHTPHLDRRLSDCKLIKLESSMYRLAWWNLMTQLLRQLQFAQ